MGKSKSHAKHRRRSKLTAYERLQWCRRQWMEDPAIPIQGPRGIIRLMKDQFGVAASYEVLSKLQEGCLRDLSEVQRIEKERAEQGKVEVAKPMNPVLSYEKIVELSAKPAGPVEKPRPAAEVPSAPVATADSAPTPPAPAPVPELEPRLSLAKGRKRTKRSDAQEREIYALQQLKIRPHMPIGGNDGLQEILRSRFGKAIGYSGMKALKEQVLAEMQEPTTLKSIMGAMAKKGETPVQGPADAESAIRTAAELIMESIPNLKEFILRVDESGKAHIDYEQHVVKKGSFTLGE